MHHHRCNAGYRQERRRIYPLCSRLCTEAWAGIGNPWPAACGRRQAGYSAKLRQRRFLYIHVDMHRRMQLFTSSTWISTLPHQVENARIAVGSSNPHNFHTLFHMGTMKKRMHTHRSIHPFLACRCIFYSVGVCLCTENLWTVFLFRQPFYIIQRVQIHKIVLVFTHNAFIFHIISRNSKNSFFFRFLKFENDCRFIKRFPFTRCRSPLSGCIFRCAQLCKEHPTWWNRHWLHKQDRK